jgi:peroxiredoxin
MPNSSRDLALGIAAPDFELPDVITGRTLALGELAPSAGLVVAFICNSCPFVKHVLGGFVEFAREYAARGLTVIAVNSNDAVAHPKDGPAQMRQLAGKRGFTFPYLYDESQQMARTYQAMCTPEFFLFDKERRLVYHGQFDDSRPFKVFTRVSGADLRSAADAILRNEAIVAEQKPGIGCSIKWKPGNAPG